MIGIEIQKSDSFPQGLGTACVAKRRGANLLLSQTRKHQPVGFGAEADTFALGAAATYKREIYICTSFLSCAKPYGFNTESVGSEDMIEGAQFAGGLESAVCLVIRLLGLGGFLAGPWASTNLPAYLYQVPPRHIGSDWLIPPSLTGTSFVRALMKNPAKGDEPLTVVMLEARTYVQGLQEAIKTCPQGLYELSTPKGVIKTRHVVHANDCTALVSSALPIAKSSELGKVGRFGRKHQEIGPSQQPFH
ncbi:hypothetical protein JOM56_011978 [Amanita muscaria]